MVAPGWIKQVSWDEKSVVVNIGKQKIEEAPEYERGMAVDREYEQKLHDHYGRDPYWSREAAARR